MINITSMYTLDTHLANHHFLVSISVSIGGCITKGGGVAQGGGTKNCRLHHSWGGVSHGGGISHWGGSSYHWSPDGKLVGVGVRGGDGGGDGGLEYSWGSGIGYGGGGNCRSSSEGGGSIGYGGCGVRSDGRSAEVASRHGGEEERQENL
jgi:hypothetical protein